MYEHGTEREWSNIHSARFRATSGEQELQEFDFDILEQQQFHQPDLAERLGRSAIQPEGLSANTNLLDLGEEDGGAPGAPVAVGPQSVVEGPPNFNIFWGESPPWLIETRAVATPWPKEGEEVTADQIGALSCAPGPTASSSAK